MLLMPFEIINTPLGLMVNNSAFGSYFVDNMENLFTYTHLYFFLPAPPPCLIMCNCVAPSCYLIFELLIEVNYDHLFLLSEIYCS